MGFYLPIEIPRVCTECPCYNNEGFVWCQADTEGHSAALGRTEEIPDWCPAVEVPTVFKDFKSAECIVETLDYAKILLKKNKDREEE